LATWIWLGAAIMFAGGFLSLSDRRLRIGVPQKAVKTVMQAGE
jgi:cytochrome c-type biogenesis protein CcmF